MAKLGLVEVDGKEEKGERSSSQWPLGPQVCGLGEAASRHSGPEGWPSVSVRLGFVWV